MNSSSTDLKLCLVILPLHNGALREPFPSLSQCHNSFTLLITTFDLRLPSQNWHNLHGVRRYFH